MIMKMVIGIPDCEEKYLLKLRREQDIINTHFSMNQANKIQGSMPLTSTNPTIPIRSGSFFLQRQMMPSPQVFEHFQ